MTRNVLFLAAVALLLTAPFINEAFHWDDPDFINAARVQAQNPAQFHLLDYSYRGRFFPLFMLRHPPLLSLYLSLFIRVAGDISEPLFHAAYLIFPVIGAVSMYSLGRRFTKDPMVAALLLVFTPGFLVMSHTIMGNLPGLSLWLAASALFIWGVDSDSGKLLWTAGGAMALAVMTFAQALALPPLLLFYALIKRKFRIRVFAVFAIPAAVYGFWRLYTQLKYGHPPAISYRVDLSYSGQATALLVFLGGTAIFPLSLLILFLRRKIDFLAAFIAIPPLVTLTAVHYISKGELTLVQGLQMAVLASAGFTVIYRLFSGVFTDVWPWLKRRGEKMKPRLRTDSLFLLAWFASVAVAYFGTTLPFVASRHLLPLFPPVILLFVRELDSFLPMRPKLRSAFVLATLVLTLAGGLLTSLADYRWANSYRSLAADLREAFAQSPVKVWELGEFDWRYYMEKEGFEYLGVNSEAHPGDIVITSEVCSRGVVAPLPEGFHRELNRIYIEDGLPLRVMNPWARAGFYGNPMGPLPFTFSTDRVDEITINELYW